LFFAELAYGDPNMSATMIGILLLVMPANLLGMLARQIIALVGVMTF
jgi:hypothetical protein